MITKLMIVLKNGEVKKYPWAKICFVVSDEHVIVTRNNQTKTFIFRTLASNVEYCEAIEEEDD